MSATCVSLVKGRIIRVMALNACGNPVTGTGNLSVQDGFISVKASPQFETGTEYTKKLANGTLCINEKDQDQLKRIELETKWCVLDPDIIYLMTGARRVTVAATNTGNFTNTGVLNTHFSLEVWQQVSGQNACTALGVQQYVYWAWPHVTNAKIMEKTIENGAFEFTMTGDTLPVGPSWGALPTVLPPSGYLGSAAWVTNDQEAWNITTIAPPTAACGAVALG